MKPLILILAFASFLFAQDSVSVAPVQVKQGVLTTSVTAYNANAILQGIDISPSGIVTVRVPAEIMPYIARDTSIKNMPPFMGQNLSWTYKNLGTDSLKIQELIVLMKQKLKAKITLK